MGLLGIFGGKKNKEDKPKDKPTDKIMIETALGRFYYVCTPNCTPPEIGYQGDVDWVGSGYEDKMGVYFDCDTPESKEATRCYEKLERILSDKQQTEYNVKSAVAEHFLSSKPHLIRNDDGVAVTKESIINDMRLNFISIYRNGDIIYSVDQAFCFDIRSDDVDVIFKADGGKEFRYNEYD